ncbi:MAG: hypothetical protein ACI81T_000740 [Bacteroidia bacterium]|jgi:hypothetical protein
METVSGAHLKMSHTKKHTLAEVSVATSKPCQTLGLLEI